MSTAEERALVLQRRAMELARPLASPDRSLARELSIFVAAGVRYAIETRFVLRVARLGAMAPLPGTPNYLPGLASVQGELLTLVDVAALFGAVRAEDSEHKKVIVCGGQHAELGLLADALGELAQVSAHGIQPLPSEHVEPCIMGVTQDGLVVLDGGALLEDERLRVDPTNEADQ